jgi:hypothetical protein
MKKKDELIDDMRPEYDLSKLKNQVRGKYVERYSQGTNLVLIEPDIFDEFPSSEAVKKAPRSLLNKKPARSRVTT